MNCTNYSNFRMDMISECRIKAIVRLREFSKLRGAQYCKAFCDIVINDTLLETHEKIYLIYDLLKIRDTQNIIHKNVEVSRKCEYCNNQVIAALYCEFCIRNYLEKQFNKWTSENEEIDKLIRKCQHNAVSSSHIIEWIPYEHFENIELETSTSNSDVYIATWKNGPFTEWDNEQRKLKRGGRGTYILKTLKISEKRYNEVMICGFS
ncbi:27917_t:CDS:1 [Dentiscutata erythropus]|uniref:27917_t:CDS:1 n=1 Tax=Dentiscutata erythropus TaxID=1348616 RepID=A0A9N9AFG3_9GLOM|nr:27917_t:CDS:1 [Dentiscutata erythropus]